MKIKMKNVMSDLHRGQHNFEILFLSASESFDKDWEMPLMKNDYTDW